jgi:DNA repair exonuclease SbcCD ATPase subunit
MRAKGIVMPEDPSKDKERLAKLWDAYETQEKEFNQALTKIKTLEDQLKDRDRIIDTLKKVVESRDRELRELEIRFSTVSDEKVRTEPVIDELKKSLREEKERYAKLFAITEELEEEQEEARKQLEARDQWFNRHVGKLEALDEALKERTRMLSAVSPALLKTSGKKPLFKEVPQTPPPKDESLASLTAIPSVDEDVADRLYTSGYYNRDQLKTVAAADLARVEGISPTLARKITDEA